MKSPFTDFVEDNIRNQDFKLERSDELCSLSSLQNETDSSKIQKLVRANDWPMENSIRAGLWQLLTARLARSHLIDNASLYEELTNDVFGPPDKRKESVTLPNFVDPLSLQIHYHLNQSGVDVHISKENAIRLVFPLSSISLREIIDKTHFEHIHPEINYAPVIFPITALMLHYTNEMQTFRCLCLVMGGADLLFTAKIPYEASKFVLKDLAKNYAKAAAKGLNKRNASNAYDDWVWWIFRDLPFSHLVRIFDCFLVDGRKLLYRVALVLLKLFFKSHVNKEDNIKITDQMKHFFSEIPLSAEQLLRKSYKIRLTRVQIRKLEKKSEMYVKSLRHQSYDKNALKKSESCESLNLKVSRSFSGPIIPVTDQTDLRAERRRSFQSVTTLPFSSNSSIVLDLAQWKQIYSWIPIRISLLVPKLLYSSMENGSTLTMLFNLIDGYEPTLLVLKTTKGFVIGAYCSADWAERKTFKNSLSYFGTGESFVFTIEPNARKFSWQGIGKSNISNDIQYFQAADNSKLTIGGGGGEALQLDENLTKGRSEKCSTFDNEVLVDGSDFVSSVVEVFGFIRDN